MEYEVMLRSKCPEHGGLGCIACGGCGYLKQWVPVVWKPLLVQVPGKAHFMTKDFMMIGDPKDLDALDLLAGSYQAP